MLQNPHTVYLLQTTKPPAKFRKQTVYFLKPSKEDVTIDNIDSTVCLPDGFVLCMWQTIACVFCRMSVPLQLACFEDALVQHMLRDETVLHD